MMLESEIQSKVIKEMERHGWYVVKLIQTNKNGIPDLLCHKNGMTKYLEIKRPKLKPSPLQDLRHKEIMRAGIVVHTVTSVDDLYLYGVLKAEHDTRKDCKSSRTVFEPTGNIWEQRLD